MSPDEIRAHLEQLAAAREASLRAGGGTWPAKRELAGALRALLEEMPASAVGEPELRALAASVREAAARFAAAGHVSGPVEGARGDGLYDGMESFHDRGPIVGLANPIAPPLTLRLDLAANVVRGTATFGAAHEGAPGLLHGGLLAAAFDELLGYATSFSGSPGMTRELTVRYERPTPIHVELHFTGRLERVDGRRLRVSAEVEAKGTRTATAHGLFIQVGGEKFSELARAKRGRSISP
jgi:acyl-coenzyme A thioesterase PaaI-like protein